MEFQVPYASDDPCLYMVLTLVHRLILFTILTCTNLPTFGRTSSSWIVDRDSTILYHIRVGLLPRWGLAGRVTLALNRLSYRIKPSLTPLGCH